MGHVWLPLEKMLSEAPLLCAMLGANLDPDMIRDSFQLCPGGPLSPVRHREMLESMGTESVDIENPL